MTFNFNFYFHRWSVEATTQHHMLTVANFSTFSPLFFKFFLFSNVTVSAQKTSSGFKLQALHMEVSEVQRQCLFVEFAARFTHLARCYLLDDYKLILHNISC